MSSSRSPPRSSTSRRTTTTPRAKILGDTLDRATETFLNEDRSPGRKLGTIDNRGSHFYLALYWAEELAEQTDDADLAAAFAALAEHAARRTRQKIVDELLAVQGKPADIGGYFRPDDEKAAAGDASVGDVQRGPRAL